MLFRSVAAAALDADNTVANIAFTGSTNTFSAASTLANDGTLTFGDATGDSFTFNGGLTTSDVGGTVTLNTSISTSNDALVFGAITLGNNITLDTNATNTTGDLTIGAVTGGSNTLTLTTENNIANADITASGNISGVTTLTLTSVGGTATFAGDVDVTTLAIGNTVANVAINGNGSTITNDIDFANDGTLQLGDASGDTLTFNGGLDTSDVGGTVTLNGTIDTSNDAITFDAVTLGSATTIDTNATDTTGDIAIGVVTGGSNALTLSMGNNVANTDISATGNISGVTTLTISNAGGTATLSGDVDVTTLTIGNTVANVAINGDGSTVTNDIDFANDGTLQLGDATGDTLTFNGGLDTSDVGGTVTLNGTIDTSNDAVTFGAVTLGSATTIDTNASNTTGDIAIGAVTGGSNNLTLTTGDNVANSDITASGAISGLGNLTLADVGGTATFSANVAAAALSADSTVDRKSTRLNSSHW